MAKQIGRPYTEDFGSYVETPNLDNHETKGWAVVELDDANGGGLPVFVSEATNWAGHAFAVCRSLNDSGPASAVYRVVEADWYDYPGNDRYQYRKHM